LKSTHATSLVSLAAANRAHNIIRVEQSKGRKDRNVMLSLLRQWWKARPSRYDAGLTPAHGDQKQLFRRRNRCRN
jgi:hypothetical protein